MARPFDTSTLSTIVAGARLLAHASDLDPDRLETIVRKAARISRERRLQDTPPAND